MSSLEIGWTEGQARSTLTRFRRLFAINLILQSLIALACIIAPRFGAQLVGLDPSIALPFLPIWGGMVIVASALQVFALLDPINHRFQVAIAMFGRALMVIIYICLGDAFWRFAAFDGLFALALSYLFYRALIAEVQTRP
ncbi:hypothetical protein [uncultured Tateyamaria sp.]|uniref:hypothetical protein n=1 Tax=uncultured Tateyamaria sp. TaxID=455651 RepID=UPI002609DD5D|nr:hypothetical protein [uncultured Tateyamaria sp.]